MFPWGNTGLKGIMCLEYERAVSNDYVVRFEKHLYQIVKANKKLPRPRDKVIIRIRLLIAHFSQSLIPDPYSSSACFIACNSNFSCSRSVVVCRLGFFVCFAISR